MIDRKCSIWVGCKSVVGEEQLQRLFEPFGRVDSVKLILDRETGRPRGYGFVNFKDHSSVDTAIAKVGRLAGCLGLWGGGSRD